jgi:Transposase, Mutator family
LACTLRRAGLCIRAECRRGKAPGEPYEGKLHVRFDEGVLETELWSGLRHRRYGESRRQPKSPFLWPPRQRPTLQLRNVIERLPKDQQEQTKSLMRAAWKLDAKVGMAKLEKLAQWLQREHPDAADSLREGIEECFTINRLDVPPSLHRCLASTNLIENPHSGVRRRTRRVCRWRDKPMAKRWAAAALLATEKNFRRVMGHKDLWALKAILDGNHEKTLDRKEKVA